MHRPSLALALAMALAAAAATTTTVGGATPLTLHLFNSSVVAEHHTVCLDGSPSGFYFRPASTAASRDKYVVFLQGGGLCVEPIDCLHRATSDLGSSKHWAPTWEDTVGLLSANGTLSPWATYNHVWVRYCSGDCHQGMDTKRTLDGLQFSGHFQIEWTLRVLDETTGLLQRAEEVLLSGGSAGGIAVFNSANYVQSMLPSATRLRAVPQAGYFFPEKLVPFPEWVTGARLPVDGPVSWYLESMFKAYLDEPCAAAQRAAGRDPNFCLSASTVYPFVRAPVFVVNNLFDEQVLVSVLWDKHLDPRGHYLEYFGRAAYASFQDQVLNSTARPGDGIILSACLQHTSNLCLASGTRVNGLAYRDVLADWYFGTNQLPHRVADACYASGRSAGQPCNPVCTGPCDPQ